MKMNPTTETQLRTDFSVHALLNYLTEASLNTRDKGDHLERLMLAFFKTEPAYKARYRNAWLWQDWPGRQGKPDTGIDLVLEERATGNLVAVQCKFFDPRNSLTKENLDSFFTASGKEPFRSRIIVSTTDKWSKHAEDALLDQQIPVTRIRIQDLDESSIDWSRFSIQNPSEMHTKPRKVLRPHQKEAVQDTLAGLQEYDRGKMIMACGTGKTFTGLKLAEAGAGSGKTVLFLVPSIALLGQTLREWTADSDVPIRAFAVCSDTKVGHRKTDEDITVTDLQIPATTDAPTLVAQLNTQAPGAMTVVFSTYQSSAVIRDAQSAGVPEFDLIICDEAHRTTGVQLSGAEQSAFTLVHSNDNIRGKKRLYMTATPRIYSDTQQTKAREADAEVWGMDDEAVYGPEFHRLNFGDAVNRGLLTDYKVLVLAVDEKSMDRMFQNQLVENSELKLDDAVKIVGIWNGLAKRTTSSVDDEQQVIDTNPMKRAVAFANDIRTSQHLANMFTTVVDTYLETVEPEEDLQDLLNTEARHVDGTFNILRRNQQLDWLKEETPPNTCRILTNARCLTEGVDVPNLDAVIFTQPRKSQIDIVQAVGRAMRLAPGKNLGYIILPVGVPAGVKPNEALDGNENFKVVWQVLQALRAHDERFDAMVNKLDLNKKPPADIDVIGISGPTEDEDEVSGTGKLAQGTLGFTFENLGEWREAIYARIVQKVGTAKYWDQWSKDVASIAQRHQMRITNLIDDDHPEHRDAFNDFLAGLQRNINPSISRLEAIEMLSQHLITKPIFEAIFDNQEFIKKNPVSAAMQHMVDLLESLALEKETESLDKFYESVKIRASGIDNAEGKQKVILELYNSFFKTAFPSMSQRLGIVYTPTEVVDFLIHSADRILEDEFNASLSDPGVQILDPFTGTGTFIVRMLQSGLIKPDDLKHKYQNELHANEIVLLAYYIAAINIEATYAELAGTEYEPFEGIVLTDTFQMTENHSQGQEDVFKVLPENSARVERQKKQDIRVLVGNPPYRSGATSANDNNQNLRYAQLDEAIRKTFAEHSTATLKNSLYDSYVRSFRWASDRIKDKGIIAYVTNGSFVDSNSMDGMRKVLRDEFSSIYVFNLRGNQRTDGELSRREGGKIFGSGSRAMIAITLLVKNPEKSGPGVIYYYDIGDYLTREQKLGLIQNFKDVSGISWEEITPNADHDWINQRSQDFELFPPLGDRTASGAELFSIYSAGLKTNRDAWVFSFSRETLAQQVGDMISFYTNEAGKYASLPEPRQTVSLVVNRDPTRISWSAGLEAALRRNKKIPSLPESIRTSLYRPYCKQFVYNDSVLIERPGKTALLFPRHGMANLAISVTGTGSSKDPSVLMLDTLPDYELISKGQCFPLYYFEPVKKGAKRGLFDSSDEVVVNGFVRKDAITDETLESYQKHYADPDITKKDIFHYVYGLLHSPEYRKRFEADLKKTLPRIPFAEDFHAFKRAGYELAGLHVNYETGLKHPLTIRNTHSDPSSAAAYRVQKMKYAGKRPNQDKSTIIFNQFITIQDIPVEAHEYIVNGKSALDWIMERYAVTTDKASGIVNDPNEYSDNPQYIFDLVQQVVHLSVETVRVVKHLPAINEYKM